MKTKWFFNYWFFIIILFICISSLQIKAAQNSLVLYFPFDEVKGDIVNDQSGNAFEGTLNEGVELTNDGKYNNALSFDGSSGYVLVEYDNSLDLTENFTVMAWTYPTIVDGAYRWVVDKTHDNDDLNYLLGISAENVFRFITRKLTNDLMAAENVTAEKWYHLAGVQDSGMQEVTLYVNGSAVVNNPLAGEKTVNDADLKIGCREWQGSIEQFFGGIIDEVAIFSEALTQEDIEKAMGGIEGFMGITPSSSLATTWSKIKTK